MMVLSEFSVLNSIMEARKKKKLSTSQRQAVIKLIEKRERDKRFTKNLRPISLLNDDYKIIAKAIPSGHSDIVTIWD